MAWIRGGDQDEIRSGFLVTAHRKRIWEIELSLLAELERVCETYGLSYYADGGTLLGAVRHEGFIPWDDDIDVVMPRPDYEKLKEVGVHAFQPPFFLQNAYTDAPFFTISKLRHSGTMAWEGALQGGNQGIFLDIFPLDAVRDGSPAMEEVGAVQMELWAMAMDEALYLQYVRQGGRSYLPAALRKDLFRQTARERFAAYERFQAEHFFDSERVNIFCYEVGGRYLHIQRAWYKETVRLPFEGGTVAAPGGYAALLHELFGDYHQFVKFSADHGNAIRFSSDVSYEAYRAAMLAHGRAGGA